MTSAIAVEPGVIDQEAGIDRRGIGDDAQPQAGGPPPLAIDWRTSTTSTRRIGPLPARCRSIQRQTDGVSRASVGTIRSSRPSGGVTSCALNR